MIFRLMQSLSVMLDYNDGDDWERTGGQLDACA